MRGPIDGLRFVHAAIMAEAEGIERDATRAQTPADARALGERLSFLAHVNDIHTTGEEQGLFPALVKEFPHVDDAYLFDHKDEKQQIEELKEITSRCALAPTPDDLESLKRQAVALAEHLIAHARKENELILPLVHERFPPEEQQAMMQAMMATMTPAHLQRVVPWIVATVPLEMAEEYLRAFFGGAPAQVVAAARDWLRSGVPASLWSVLQARMPELAEP